MKNLTIIIILLITSSAMAISTKQDNNNLAYLDELDIRLINTIDLISAFNESMKGLVDNNVANAEDFSHFLMDLVLECSAMRKLITQTRDLDDFEREYSIPLLFDYIKPPDEISRHSSIAPDLDKRNRIKLNEMYIEYEDKLNRIRGSIIKEEEIIIQNRALTPKFVALHTRHFIYHLILDFVADHQYLSAPNRQYLIDIIEAVERGMNQ